MLLVFKKGTACRDYHLDSCKPLLIESDQVVSGIIYSESILNVF